jgi:hypothetical protein
MNKQIHNHTKKLDELLQHLESGNEGLDAFEQDALEGFKMLSNANEVKQLKEKTDERFTREIVSTKHKPSTIRLFWAAAAGLALLIGIISIFKFYNPAEKQHLAQNLPVSEESLVPSNEIDKDLISGKTLQKEVKEESPSEDKIRPDQEKKAPSPIAQTGNSKENSYSREAAAGASMQDNILEDEAVSSKATESDVAASKMAPAKDAMGGATPGSEAKNTTADREEQKQDKKEERVASVKSKKSMQNAPAAASEQMYAESMPPVATSNFNTSALTISEKELQARLHEFMKLKSYKQSFSCVLKLSDKGDIRDITFTNSRQFNRNQEKEITNFIKGLNCFQSSQAGSVSYYTLTYNMP